MSAKSKLRIALEAIDNAKKSLNKAKHEIADDSEIRRALRELEDAETEINRALRQIQE